MKQLLIAVKATIVLTLLTGFAYPLLVTGLSQILFHDRANGSLIVAGGKTAGSEFIGQHFTKPEYFHGRPDGYDGLSSGGSNFGPTNQKLIDRVGDDAKKFRAENPTFTGPIPADILTSSGSGLDPHISPEAAEAQVDRVAGARGTTADAIRQLVAANTEGRQFGIWGEPRVNVLRLNLALDGARYH